MPDYTLAILWAGLCVGIPLIMCWVALKEIARRLEDIARK